MAKALLGLFICALATGCPPDGGFKSRPAGGSDGSSIWALAIAQPAITAAAGDAELRQIIGTSVFVDGRLPSNGGNWSFVAYSPSMTLTIQVTVDADGKADPTTRTESAPGPGIQVPLPGNTVGSQAAFGATDGHRAAGATISNLCGINLASYTQAPGVAVWAMNFDAGDNQLVKFDGTYLGPE